MKVSLLNACLSKHCADCLQIQALCSAIQDPANKHAFGAEALPRQLRRYYILWKKCSHGSTYRTTSSHAGEPQAIILISIDGALTRSLGHTQKPGMHHSLRYSLYAYASEQLQASSNACTCNVFCTYSTHNTPYHIQS